MATVEANSDPPAPDDVGVNASSRLATLPEELLSQVAVKLGSDDIAALRLTCKDVEAKSLHEFATEYFAAKCFMFTTDSLKVLANIANSNKLRRFLKDVFLITATFPESPLQCEGRSGCLWSPTVRQREAYHFYMQDQKKLQESEKDKRFLVDAFKNLPELRGLRIVDAPSSLPAGVECRGLNKFRRTTSIRPFFAPADSAHDSTTAEFCSAQTHVFKTMLRAVAESGIDTITHFGTRFRSSNFHGLSPLTDFNLKTKTLRDLGDAFVGLSNLTLQFRTHLLCPGKDDTLNDLTRATKRMKALAPVFGSTTSLTLIFDNGEWSKQICWSLTASLDLGRLTQLVIQGLSMDMPSLLSIINKLKSTRFLSFQAVELSGENDSWAPVLAAIKTMPSLQHLHLMYLLVCGQRAFFLEPVKPGDEDDESGNGFGAENYPDEWMDDEGSDSDDEPPDLIPQDDLIGRHESGESAAEEEAVPRTLPQVVNKCEKYTGKDFRAPAETLAPGATTSERGYHICLAGQEEIQKYLPIFMREANLGGEEMMDYDNIFNAMLGVGGPPIPLPPIFAAGPPGPPQPQGQAAGGQNSNGAAPPPPNAAPPNAGGGNVPGATALLNSLQGLFGTGNVHVSFGGGPMGAPPHPQAAAGAGAGAGAAANVPANPPPANGPPPAHDGTAGQQLGEPDDFMFEDQENDIDHGEMDDVD